MKKILIILLVIHSQSLFAQIDESKIKIIAKDYYFYEFSKEDTYDESGSLYVDSVLSDVVEMSYPYIQTPDSVLNTFINDTILKIIGIDIKNSFLRRYISYDSLEEITSVSYTTFTINFISL